MLNHGHGRALKFFYTLVSAFAVFLRPRLFRALTQISCLC